ncbi:MAG: hypothetical protein ACI837_000903 [Crocinitomicaceae bacterium]|jgi:hypothetical protein
MKAILTVICCWSLSALNAQTIAGFVYSEDDQVLRDVKISSLLTDSQTRSNQTGFFEISVVPRDTLILEKDGLSKAYIAVSNVGDTIITTMQQQVQSLRDVNINATSKTQEQTANVRLNLLPVKSSQEVLTLIPGLFVAQHAGGGKAEQLFLRGYDLDHGTDIQIGVEGVPVNSVSHAHGQGYTDLHFMLPQLIDKISFEKGPYRLDKGNFSTAGWVDFKLKKKLERNQLSMSYGSFNNLKVNGATTVLDRPDHSAYIAGSWNKSDGYFDSKQNLNRLNFMANYRGKINSSTILEISSSAFYSSWTASGQVPIRAIDNGLIGRFGAIDNTEGGTVSRSSIQVNLSKFFKNRSSLKFNAYTVLSDFELYSNFTFFLRDSINGDQIKQKENRRLHGFNSDYQKKWKVRNTNIQLLSGIGLRYDNIDDLELAYTVNRAIKTEQVQFGDVDELNYFAYLGGKITWHKWSLYGGIRLEEIYYRYKDRLTNEPFILAQTQNAILPKTSLTYQPNEKLKAFAKWGTGFHSNDTRTVLSSNESDRLPLVFSYDLGFEFKPTKDLILNLAYWNLKSQQEFIYVGDEGIVEANGGSKRQGIDVGVAWQALQSLYFFTNANYSHARSDDETRSYIPIAAPITLSTGLQFIWKKHFLAAWTVQYMGDRPADETNSTLAEGYCLNNVKLTYKRKMWQAQLQVNNIFNVDWNETQFLTESRLQNEVQSTEEIHFTPGAPISAELSLSIFF